MNVDELRWKKKRRAPPSLGTGAPPGARHQRQRMSGSTRRRNMQRQRGSCIGWRGKVAQSRARGMPGEMAGSSPRRTIPVHRRPPNVMTCAGLTAAPPTLSTFLGRRTLLPSLPSAARLNVTAAFSIGRLNPSKTRQQPTADAINAEEAIAPGAGNRSSGPKAA